MTKRVWVRTLSKKTRGDRTYLVEVFEGERKKMEKKREERETRKIQRFQILTVP